MTNKDLQEKILARLVELINSFGDASTQQQHSIKEEVDLLLKIAAAIGGLDIGSTYSEKYKTGDINYSSNE